MDALLVWVKLGVGLVVGVILLFYVVWPLIKGLNQPLGSELERKAPKGPLPGRNQPQASTQASQEIPTKTPGQIVEIAKKDPLLTAQLVRKWLKEKER